MDALTRATLVYLFLLVLFRIAGKRTLAEITTFDFVLLLIIAEATQQALLGEDFSVINCFILVAPLVLLDIGLSLLKDWSPSFERLIDGLPVVVVKDGELLHDRMKKLRIDEDDILESARRLQGLARLDQVAYAVLEKNGGITVVPKKET